MTKQKKKLKIHFFTFRLEKSSNKCSHSWATPEGFILNKLKNQQFSFFQELTDSDGEGIFQFVSNNLLIIITGS